MLTLYSHTTSVKTKKSTWVPQYELKCKPVWDLHVSPNVLFSDLGFHPGISLHLVIVPLSLSGLGQFQSFFAFHELEVLEEE